MDNWNTDIYYSSYVMSTSTAVSLTLFIVFLSYLISFVVCGAVCKRINEKKGYNGGWAWGLLGIVGIIICACRNESLELRTNHLQSVLIYVLQKTPDWTVGTTYEQYKFYPLKFTRWKDIRSDQAYLVLQKESEGIGSNDANDPGMSGGPNPSGIGMRFIHAYDDEPMVSDDAGLVDRINDIQRNATLDGEFYSISGVRVAAPTKGLYIVNGKKVLVK